MRQFSDHAAAAAAFVVVARAGQPLHSLVNLDGTLERVTLGETFDALWMFPQDGKHVMLASNRQIRTAGETSVFIAGRVA